MVEIGVGLCVCLCSVGFGYFSFPEKKCGFFPFWSNECVLNCNVDVLCLIGEKMREKKIFLNCERWILLSLGSGKT